jgi:hypothetical protein
MNESVQINKLLPLIEWQLCPEWGILKAWIAIMSRRKSFFRFAIASGRSITNIRRTYLELLLKVKKQKKHINSYSAASREVMSCTF